MEHIFSLWPSIGEMARDLGDKYPTVAAWKQRGRIPPDRDTDVIKAAKARGIELTREQLDAARKPRRIPSVVPQ